VTFRPDVASGTDEQIELFPTNTAKPDGLTDGRQLLDQQRSLEFPPGRTPCNGLSVAQENSMTGAVEGIGSRRDSGQDLLKSTLTRAHGTDDDPELCLVEHRNITAVAAQSLGRRIQRLDQSDNTIKRSRSAGFRHQATRQQCECLAPEGARFRAPTRGRQCSSSWG